MKASRTAQVVVAAMVVLTAFVGAVAAEPSGDDEGTTPVAGDGGHRFDVGDGEPHITFWVHLDLFTNLGSAGDFGFSAVGTALNTEIIAVDLQLNFAGVGPLGEFLSDPFSRFSVTAEWELHLPFLATGPAADENFDYEDNQTIAPS